MGGWIEFDGGKEKQCPVGMDDYVEIKQRNGLKFAGYAHEFYWGGGVAKVGYEIIAYRVIE